MGFLKDVNTVLYSFWDMTWERGGQAPSDTNAMLAKSS